MPAGLDTAPEKKNGSSPQFDGIISLPGLNDSVTVSRDERATSHIYATCEHDLYMATGYIAARECLWQMDLVRRSASGRLSEVFGESHGANIISHRRRLTSTADFHRDHFSDEAVRAAATHTLFFKP